MYPQGPSVADWDIVGGPGQQPSPPIQADYEPGGKWYGLVSYDTAMRHYQHALDAYQNGYWYHANGRNWTQDQERFNNNLVQSGNIDTSYGVPSGNLYQASQDFIDYTYDPNTGWHQVNGSGPSGVGGGSGGYGGGSGGTGGGSNVPNTNGMSSEQKSAFSSMYALLDQFGLSGLGDFLKGLILDGTTDAATLQLELQQTDIWKRRFAGNEMLKQKGLGVLSPAEYLATERSYAQVMKNYGLPSGFYDEPGDFAKFIGNNVSAAELQTRVSAYADLANREDPAMVQQLKSMGMGQGDLLAYMMDPERATPLIQRQYQTAVLGSAARRAGVAADNTYLGQLASRGVTEQQAAQGYGMIGQSLADANKLAQIDGVSYGLHDMESEVFDNNATAANKRKRLASQERARFSGQSGYSGVNRSTTGSY